MPRSRREVLWEYVQIAVVALIGIVLVSLLVFGYYSVSNLSSDRVIIVSQLIVQLDSFLTAGWAVGFFFFWGTVSKGTRDFFEMFLSGETDPKLKGTGIMDFLRRNFPGQKTEKAAPNTRREGAQVILLRLLSHTYLGGIYFVALVSLMGFVISAMFSVEAVITGFSIFVFLSFVSLVIGTVLMVISWYLLNLVSDVVFSTRFVRDALVKVVEGLGESEERTGDDSHP